MLRKHCCRTLRGNTLRGMDTDADSNETMSPDAGSVAVVPLVPTAGQLLDGEPTEAHDRAVQAALYSRATGYVRTRQVVVRGSRIPVTVQEDVPPDAGAAIKWLQARNPLAWGEKKQAQLHVVIDRMGDGRERIAVGYREGDALPAIQVEGQDASVIEGEVL